MRSVQIWLENLWRECFSTHFFFFTSLTSALNILSLKQRLRHFDQSFKEPDEVILSMDNAKKELERNCRYIARNFRKFPSYEISRLQERNTFLLVAMASIEVQK